ncbi:ABCG1 [Symbiodinium necroappetens]|uniref:ABCG1 protein n=1 Tax=Symbiodinium necroappetens TaxID=1628268 RepID=A0A812IZH7_9DINO|nr:ABCG1 [Symbiodinium necroappetens]
MIMETPAAATPDVPHDKSVMTKTMEGATAGFLTQLMALSKRASAHIEGLRSFGGGGEAQNIWRDKPGLIASIIIPVILNVFFAAIFYQAVGDITLDNYDPRSHFGGMTQVAIGGMFGAAQPLLLKFPLDRGIFLREYATSTYGSAAYFLSKTMVELPQSFLNAVITWTAAYFLMGLRGQFMIYVLVFWVTGVAAASTAVLVGCLAANAEVAQQAAPAVFVPQLLFAGFFITTEPRGTFGLALTRVFRVLRPPFTVPGWKELR